MKNSRLLGQPLSDQEFFKCLRQMQILDPTAGKRFWQSCDQDSAGVYLILTGKVRLLDRDDNLLTTLGADDSFGELSLFSDESFQPYAARASINLKLCYLPSQLLQPLICRYPAIREHLHQQAVRRNWVLLESGENEEEKQRETGKYRDTETRRRGDAETWRRGDPEILQPKIPYSSSRLSTLPSRHKISRAYFPSPTVRVGHWWQRISHRYPFYAQQTASDCGAACLVMVARYWGKHFSINRLRDIANVDSNGASLQSLTTAAESVGFFTRPVKASLDKLAEQTLPAIAHWEGKHFVVV